jgi:hypothetical protein
MQTRTQTYGKPHAYSRRRNDPGEFGGRLLSPDPHPMQAPLASKGWHDKCQYTAITRSLRLQSDYAHRRQTKVKMSAIAKQFRYCAKQLAKLCAIL